MEENSTTIGSVRNPLIPVGGKAIERISVVTPAKLCGPEAQQYVIQVTDMFIRANPEVMVLYVTDFPEDKFHYAPPIVLNCDENPPWMPLQITEWDESGNPLPPHAVLPNPLTLKSLASDYANWLPENMLQSSWEPQARAKIDQRLEAIRALIAPFAMACFGSERTVVNVTLDESRPYSDCQFLPGPDGQERHCPALKIEAWHPCLRPNCLTCKSV